MRIPGWVVFVGNTIERRLLLVAAASCPLGAAGLLQLQRDVPTGPLRPLATWCPVCPSGLFFRGVYLPLPLMGEIGKARHHHQTVASVLET